MNGARALGCWVDDAPGREPQMGDIYFLSNGPPLTEHVGIVLDPDVRRSADAGQTNDAGQQCARIVTRRIDDQRAQGGPRLLSGPDGGGELRKLVGWVNLDAVPLEAEPSGPAIVESPATQAVPWVAVALGALGVLGLGALAVKVTKGAPSTAPRFNAYPGGGAFAGAWYGQPAKAAPIASDLRGAGWQRGWR